MSARSIAEALGKAERDGKGWKCLCPIHDDHKPSLSICDDGGKVLIHCHVCGKDGQAELIEELKRRDLWPRRTLSRKKRNKVVATYDYRDETGELRYQVVRYENKKFSQRRPSGNDSWIWDMTGVEPLPYQLPELIAAPENATIFIAEGEKDVDALLSIGTVATCNSSGAGKWRKEISHWLAGRRVVIIPDNDDVGRQHARDVAAKLSGAASVKTLILPGGGKDPADWIAAGGTIEELLLLVEEASEDPATLGSPLPGGLEGEVLPPDIEFVPLGYTRDERFAILDPVRRIVVCLTANQVISTAQLLAIAPLRYWEEKFPAFDKRPFDAVAAGNALMTRCRALGPFNMAKIRGRGVWIDRGEVVVNLGGPVPDPRYVCFEPLVIEGAIDNTAPRRLLGLLNRFKWRNQGGDALLALGWIAIAPICGVLDWRPHIWVHGQTQTGKSTVYRLLKAMTSPLCLSLDGSSTEAGIRQTLGPDSLAVIIDEFESDHDQDRVRGIIRLARSASSAEDAVLRGTPEGRAMRFCLRTTFALLSINPSGMEPADENRIVLLELTPHDNKSETAEAIARETLQFERQSGAWCAMMVERAALICPTIAMFEPLINAGERRHRQNMATLLAGASVALTGTVPNEAEAKILVKSVTQTVETHADDVKRDDGRECLDYLYAHPVQTAHGTFPLWHWIGVVVHGSEDPLHAIEAGKLLQKYDIMVVEGAGPLDPGGIVLKNTSATINRIFITTKWRGGWARALKKIEGVSNLGNKTQRFPSGVSKATMLPF
jgi:hypothetical protein